MLHFPNFFNLFSAASFSIAAHQYFWRSSRFLYSLRNQKAIDLIANFDSTPWFAFRTIVVLHSIDFERFIFRSQRLLWANQLTARLPK
jgi:hypothetical protein